MMLEYVDSAPNEAQQHEAGGTEKEELIEKLKDGRYKTLPLTEVCRAVDKLNTVFGMRPTEIAEAVGRCAAWPPEKLKLIRELPRELFELLGRPGMTPNFMMSLVNRMPEDELAALACEIRRVSPARAVTIVQTWAERYGVHRESRRLPVTYEHGELHHIAHEAAVKLETLTAQFETPGLAPPDVKLNSVLHSAVNELLGEMNGIGNVIEPTARAIGLKLGCTRSGARQFVARYPELFDDYRSDVVSDNGGDQDPCQLIPVMAHEMRIAMMYIGDLATQLRSREQLTREELRVLLWFLAAADRFVSVAGPAETPLRSVSKSAFVPKCTDDE